MDVKFGRRYAEDVRDRLHPMRAHFVQPPQYIPKSRYYNPGHLLPLDQGATGTCVAHAWIAFLCAALVVTPNPPDVFDTYRGIVLIDEFPDNDFEAKEANGNLQLGTSVRGGAKYLQSLGKVKSYSWTSTPEEMAQWILLNKGTIVLGTNWDWDMMETDRKGFVHRGGDLAGGHSYLCIGYDSVRRAFRCLNSWGRSWGQQGRFWVKYEDMQSLLDEEGEACAAIEQVSVKG